MSSDPARLDFDSAGALIATYRWDPDGEPRAIAQITHGVGEHALRYLPIVADLVLKMATGPTAPPILMR